MTFMSPIFTSSETIGIMIMFIVIVYSVLSLSISVLSTSIGV